MNVLSQLLLASALRAAAALEPGGVPEGEVTIAPSTATYVAAAWAETVLHSRPWIPSKRVATLSRGTRLVVRGEVASRDATGCAGKLWYAVHPFGYVCSQQIEASDRPPDTALALPLQEGKRLPFSYAYVREDGSSMFDTVESVEAGTPSRTLVQGMSMVVRRMVDIGGQEYAQTDEGLVAKDDIRWGGQGPAWSGVSIDGTFVGPSFAWVSSEKAPVYAAPEDRAARVDSLARRQRVPLLEQRELPGGHRWSRIGSDRWMRDDHLNEVFLVTPPSGVLPADDPLASAQWIDVDVGEQTLVAYRSDRPVFATLISSGRGHPTPLGNYPIWAKVATMTMANQEYEDKAYMVQGVPWVLLFQGHNALHGAYWHDRFGARKSHGCVNLSPLDARFIFEWTGPALPVGWTGYLPERLDRSVVVHVRDSSQPLGQQFTQDRPIGPPDRDEEQRKLELAEARRAEEAAAAGSSPTWNPEHDGDPASGQAPHIDPPPAPAIVAPPEPTPVPAPAPAIAPEIENAGPPAASDADDDAVGAA